MSFLSTFLPKEEEDSSKKTYTSPKVFKLPIQYLEDSEKHPLSDIVAKDLELVESPLEKNMYDYVFHPTSLFSKELLPEWKTHFTTDISFLEQSQEIAKTVPKILTSYEVPCQKIKDIWYSVKYDPAFMEKYGFLEWAILDEFNHSQTFLQSISICNILSPLFSFIIPFLFLLFPFIILKIQGVPITLSIYFDCLTQIARNHFIGKALMTFKSFSIESLFYLLGSLGLYLLQMYNNTVQCLRFYKNTQFINTSLCTLKEYVDDSMLKMSRFVDMHRNKCGYSSFCKEVSQQYSNLAKIKTELQSVCPFEVNLYKASEIGYMLKCFYELHTNTEYETAILYSMGFEGYLQQMNSVNQLLNRGVLGLASFREKLSEDPWEEYLCEEYLCEEYLCEKSESPESGSESETEYEKPESPKSPKKYIKEQFYPPLQDGEYVVNDADLDQKMIITGPNASGKTTFLKTTAINLLFSQQFGCGFYKSCYFRPYTHFHSYLNIPDTSGRDSLFQAESRRCKEILNVIQREHERNRHFCIFDELYSGTNPTEATKSAYAFLQYLSEKYPKVDLLLTTHYVEICDKIQDIRNYRMQVIENGEKMEFTYKIESGISRIQGAVKILEEMEYPEEIIDMIREIEF